MGKTTITLVDNLADFYLTIDSSKTQKINVCGLIINATLNVQNYTTGRFNYIVYSS